MNKPIPLFLALGFLIVSFGHGQNADTTNWYTVPQENVQGRLNYRESPAFSRLPQQMEQDVREPVWRLSQNSAGLYLDFVSDADSLTVRYQVAGGRAMPHMPATGVSGVDLYMQTVEGDWHWVRGHYSFGDSIRYSFKNLNPAKSQIKYRLYLPLYNTVSFLEIGISAPSSLDFLGGSNELPIVVYGTSIVQGACATRSGMAWPSILGREMNVPIVNLGFSGNGRLEEVIIDFIISTEARAYILDCMPNFRESGALGPEEAYKRVLASVVKIRESKPSTPIVLVAHSGYANTDTQLNRNATFNSLNKASEDAFNTLISQGVKELYWVSKSDLGLGKDSFVDGVHPNDYGMLQYAWALRGVLD